MSASRARIRLISLFVLLSAVTLAMVVSDSATAADLPLFANQVESTTGSDDLNSLDQTLANVDTIGPVETFNEHYPNGNVRIQREVMLDAEGNYVNHGTWKMWSQAGKVVAEGQFDMGLRIGTWTRWHDRNSSPLLQQAPFNRFKAPFLSQVTFVDGQMDGEWMVFDADQKKCCQTSIKMGKRHGLKITWLSNGKILHQESFENSLPVGDLLQLNTETGEPKRVATYLKGRRIVSKAANYRRSNQKQSKEMFLAPTTVVKTPDDFWNLKFAQYSAEGDSLRHGLSQHWHPNGHLALSGQYDHDKRVGNFTYWYTNGHKASEGEFRDDNLHGTWVWWHENGQKSAIGQYRNDAYIGQWRWWKKDGKLSKQLVYDGAHKAESVADRRMEMGPPSLKLLEPQR